MTERDLVARVEALEKKFGMQASQNSSRNTLAAEIEAVEKRIESMTAAAPCAEEEKDEDKKASDDDDADDKKEEATCASEKAPGIEDEITQDKFSEVEGERHGEELATFDSMEEAGRQVGKKTVASEEFVARMKKASERLDRVAEYLEKHGRRELAFRIDKIADAIDSRIGGK